MRKRNRSRNLITNQWILLPGPVICLPGLWLNKRLRNLKNHLHLSSSIRMRRMLRWSKLKILTLKILLQIAWWLKSQVLLPRISLQGCLLTQDPRWEENQTLTRKSRECPHKLAPLKWGRASLEALTPISKMWLIIMIKMGSSRGHLLFPSRMNPHRIPYLKEISLHYCLTL